MFYAIDRIPDEKTAIPFFRDSGVTLAVFSRIFTAADRVPDEKTGNHRAPLEYSLFP